MRKKKLMVNNREEIYILTLEDCSYCSLLKDSLLKLKIPFHNIDIDRNSHLGDQVEINYGTGGYYPVIMYGEDVFLPQTNLAPTDSIHIFQTIDEALELLLKKYYEV